MSGMNGMVGSRGACCIILYILCCMPLLKNRTENKTAPALSVVIIRKCGYYWPLLVPLSPRGIPPLTSSIPQGAKVEVPECISVA